MAKVFIDLEIAYDRVSREVILGALKEYRLPIVYVKIIQDNYDKEKTKVKRLCGETQDFG